MSSFYECVSHAAFEIHFPMRARRRQRVGVAFVKVSLPIFLNFPEHGSSFSHNSLQAPVSICISPYSAIHTIVLDSSAVCSSSVGMPHTRIRAGMTGTAGTAHHCPGAKISRYVKMGPCKVGRDSYCLTHQTQCPELKCRKQNWAYLIYDECQICGQRRDVSIIHFHKSRNDLILNDMTGG